MTPLDVLRQDHEALGQILSARRAVVMETLPVSVQLLWGIYLHILEDALTTLHSLIQFLEVRR